MKMSNLPALIPGHLEPLHPQTRDRMERLPDGILVTKITCLPKNFHVVGELDLVSNSEGTLIKGYSSIAELHENKKISVHLYT